MKEHYFIDDNSLQSIFPLIRKKRKFWIAL